MGFPFRSFPWEVDLFRADIRSTVNTAGSVSNTLAATGGGIDTVMRQEHRAGEKLFVDYAGQTMEVIDAGTGEVKSICVRPGRCNPD